MPSSRPYAGVERLCRVLSEASLAGGSEGGRVDRWEWAAFAIVAGVSRQAAEWINGTLAGKVYLLYGLLLWRF